MRSLLIHLILSVCVFAEASKFDQDRAAILKMAGKFAVNFRFEETLAVQKDYTLKKPYNESAYELVKVVEDTGTRITLQHLLVVPAKEDSKSKEPLVVKHWAQTWTYEDTQITAFKAKRHWETSELSDSDIAGTWSQLVSQVDESPRYEGYGTWKHDQGRSIWVSNQTNRPLPRREYTKRKDYDLLECVNRHVVTSAGWAHEQYNAKLVNREGEPRSYISHEIGLNTYTLTDTYDFSPAENYWSKYGNLWDDVRTAWNEIYTEHPKIKISPYENDETLREMTYDLIEMAELDGKKALTDAKNKILVFLKE